MTNEEFQKIVLDELRSLNGKVDGLGEGQTRLEERQTRLEEGQSKLEERQTRLEEGQVRMEHRLDNIEKDIKAVIEQTADLTEFREETKQEFNEIHNTLSKIEIVAAGNWRDIAKLKSAR